MPARMSQTAGASRDPPLQDQRPVSACVRVPLGGARKAMP